jgi:hypothetical protein
MPVKTHQISVELPDSYYALGELVYRNLPFCYQQQPQEVNQLLRLAGEGKELLFFELDGACLLGIFKPKEQQAAFAFWECLTDFDACQELFQAFESAARERGCVQLDGPLHFNTFHRYRLRLGEAAPSWLQFDREPVNPCYYSDFLSRLGYQTKHLFESRLLQTRIIPTVYSSKKDLVESVKQLPYAFIPLNRKSWEEHELGIYELIGAIFGQNPGFQSVQLEEFKLLYNATYAEALCPLTSLLLADKSTGQLVAISLCHPNYSPLQLAGPPNFEVHYPLLQHRTLLAKTQGVHPDYRQKGLMNYLGAYGMLSFRAYYDDIIFCLMREDNPSLRFTDGFAHEKCQYASYHKRLS